MTLLLSLACAPTQDGSTAGDSAKSRPRVTLKTNHGDIVIELFRRAASDATDESPDAGETFRQYVSEGYYDDTIFHEAQPDQWIIGGRYGTDLKEKDAKLLVNGSDNGLINLRGRVALYGPEGVDSGPPQFLINLSDNPDSDFDPETGALVDYTIIGRVIEGIGVADEIGSVETEQRSTPSLSNLPKTPVSVNDPDLGLETYVEEEDEDEDEDEDEEPEPEFGLAAAVSYEAGNGPSGITAGDLNDDRDVDLVVANGASGNVAVLLSNGDGTFEAAENYTAESSPSSLASGDLDKDGDLDLAVTNRDSDRVTILLNDGNGGFEAGTGFATGNAPVSVVAGDFDKDGNLDLAVANLDSDTVTVKLGDGDGIFSFGHTIKTTPTPEEDQEAEPEAASGARALAAGDVDGDGYPDLVVANQDSDNVSVLLNKGNGAFEATVTWPAGSRPRAVLAEDLDGSNGVDLLVVNESANNVVVRLNDGSGTFDLEASFTVGTSPSSVTAADLDEDGDLDLVAANQGSNSVSVMLNKGNGSFEDAQDFPAGNGPVSVAAGDFDDDGDLDIAVANRDSNDISVLLNTMSEPGEEPEPGEPEGNPHVRLTTSMGEVVLEVLESEAPITAANFLQYVEDEFYDGTIFHRVIADFVVQGGGFLPGLSKKEGLRDPIVNEFSADRPNVRGTVAMAKTSDPDSATSQFFINVVDNPSLDDPANSGGFTVFARVIEGMDVVDAMAAVETAARADPEGNEFQDVPVEDIVLTSARLEEAPTEPPSDEFITTESGLQYKDVVQGTGDLVTEQSTIRALYTGRLTDENGDIFDSTEDGEPAEFSLTSVIEGWQEGLGNYDMREGGKRILIIPPDLAYAGFDKPGIPAWSTLWFEVEVIEVVK